MWDFLLGLITPKRARKNRNPYRYGTPKRHRKVDNFDSSNDAFGGDQTVNGQKTTAGYRADLTWQGAKRFIVNDARPGKLTEGTSIVPTTAPLVVS